jgi:glycerate 2-kinase
LKILIAPDKFKGSLPAKEVCDAIEEGLLARYPTAQIAKIPLADGGEGTFEILMSQSKGRIKKLSVLDPLFRPIQAGYGISKDGDTAFIEMAKASGLLLLTEEERNPLHTSTIGTGQLIADALDEGVSHIILGIGGSATNDAGIGMMTALGFQFISRQKEELSPIGQSLLAIETIDSSRCHPRLNDATFTVLCDVSNPLYGPTGAAHVYAPQKGASALEVAQLESGLMHFAKLAEKLYGLNLNFPGAGAAGGLGAAGKLFLNATLQRGIDYVSTVVRLEKEIEACDHVVTGEGKVDSQTFSGKVVAHVVELSKRYAKPVTVICGQCAYTDNELQAKGINRLIRLAPTLGEVENAMTDTFRLLVKKGSLV